MLEELLMSTIKAKFDPIQLEEEVLDPEQALKEPSYIIAREMEINLEEGSETERSDTTTLRTTEPQGRRVFFIREAFNPQHNFKVLQRWEGTISEVLQDECVAQIRDLTVPGNPVEEISFSLEELPESDGHLVQPGAVFYWSIGYDDRIDGQRNRRSTIRFRRLPVWTDKELEAAQRKAEAIRRDLGWTEKHGSVE
jgi:hypothetical protein